MTLLADPVAALPSGSHAVTSANGKTVVHAVELFVGYDEAIHKGNKVMAEYTADRVAAIVAGTTALMARGQYPAITISHPNSAHEGPLLDERPSVGRVSAVWMSDRNGAPVILGDMEYPDGEFSALVATNRYPRRSAEFFDKPPRIGAVALLGGDTPRSPVEDTLFSEGKAQSIEAEQRTNFSTGIGGGMPVAPTYAKETTMTEEMKKEIMSMCRAAFSELIAEREKTMSEDKDKDDDKGDDMSESMRSALKQRDDRIASLEQERRVNFAEKKMAEFSAKGLSINPTREAEVKQWLADVGPENGEKVAALIADLCAGATPTRRIDMSAAQPQGGRKRLEMQTIERLSTQYAGDTKGYLAAVEAAKQA